MRNEEKEDWVMAQAPFVTLRQSIELKNIRIKADFTFLFFQLLCHGDFCWCMYSLRPLEYLRRARLLSCNHDCASHCLFHHVVRSRIFFRCVPPLSSCFSSDWHAPRHSPQIMRRKRRSSSESCSLPQRTATNGCVLGLTNELNK